MTEFYSAPGARASAPAEIFRKNSFYGTNPPPFRARETAPDSAVRPSPSPASGGRQAPTFGDTRNPSTPPLHGAPVSALAGDTADVLRTVRADRYRLLGAARTLLVAAGARAGLEYPHNYARTAKCCYICADKGGVSVLLAPELQRAFYAGLVTCGSVWACPVCAAKIQERRRLEIAQAIDWAYDVAGLQPVMVTLTFPHRSWHSLADLLEQQARALHLLRTGKPWAKFKAKYGYSGVIRSLELTRGEKDGWHPHTHELWFVKQDPEGAPNSVATAMHAEILKMWESACRRAGMLVDKKINAFRAFSVNVKGNCSASDYLAKQDDSKNWGVDREIAKGSTKEGRAKGLHPFGLLAKSADGDVRAGRLFLAYTIAMKGKRQIFWSPGLKEKVGVKDVKDETLAAEQREKADVLGALDADDWHTIRTTNTRAQVLDAAETGGWPAVQQLIEVLTLIEIERLEAKIAALGVP